MVWRIEFAADAERDFSLIFDHLMRSYRDFGDDSVDAFDRAARRVRLIGADAAALAAAPYRGTLRTDIADGIRSVTVNRAIFWFEVLEVEQTVRILAVRLGGQDHIRHMVQRLLERRYWGTRRPFK